MRAARVDQRAAAAHGFLPADLAGVGPGAVLVALDGTQLVVTPGGQLDPWPPDGRRSIASDPAAYRRAA